MRSEVESLPPGHTQSSVLNSKELSFTIYRSGV
jgi:hypothetical protein